VNLYKSKKLNKITASQTARLDQLEWALSVEDIVLYRSLAELELKKEQVTNPKNPPKPSTPTASQEGWVKWLWQGLQGKPHATETSEMSTPSSPTLDSHKMQELQNELLQAIEFDFIEPKSVDSFIENDVSFRHDYSPLVRCQHF
jgi:hypothetical protein